MSGVPPLAGFFGKYFLFISGYLSEHFALIIFGMLTSVVSTYYYLKIIKILLFEAPTIVNIKGINELNETFFTRKKDRKLLIAVISMLIS